MNIMRSVVRYSAAILLFVATPKPVFAQDLIVTVENLNAAGGNFLTPVWFGFHDGSFDSYDPGSPASAGLERLAEDGVIDPISDEFAAAAPTGVDDFVRGPAGFGDAPVLDPGEVASQKIAVDPANRYFSYASMLIASNDAFIANGNPLAHQVYDAGGNFTPVSFLVLGSDVLDAGTEDNTEMEAAFLNQTGPDAGDTTIGGVVGPHPGFIDSQGNPGGTAIILSGTAVNAAGEPIIPSAADFTQSGFQVARITISQVPEPASAGLALLALGGLRLVRRR